MSTYYPTMTVRQCALCGKDGAKYRTPKGEFIHTRCGQKKWAKELAAAKKKGKA